jgi:uncharacterized protein with PIN domain
LHRLIPLHNKAEGTGTCRSCHSIHWLEQHLSNQQEFGLYLFSSSRSARLRS